MDLKATWLRTRKVATPERGLKMAGKTLVLLGPISPHIE